MTLAERIQLEDGENEIILKLDEGKKVYIESGAAVDRIISYSIRKFKTYPCEEREVTFTTSACIFPKSLRLENYDNVDTEEFNGNLFVHVW